jgi:hypothetical protein
LSTSKLKARNAQRISDLQRVQLALEEYFDDHGYYPRCDGGTRTWVSGSTLAGSDICDGQINSADYGDFDKLQLAGYLSGIPVDPINGVRNNLDLYYCYYRGYRKRPDSETPLFTGLATDYVLAARLEDATYTGYGAPSGTTVTMCGKLYRNVILGN